MADAVRLSDGTWVRSDMICGVEARRRYELAGTVFVDRVNVDVAIGSGLNGSRRCYSVEHETYDAACAERDRIAREIGWARDEEPDDPEPWTEAADDPAKDSAGFDRLVFDPNISTSSPVVRGTWVTAGQVVSLIVDNWTWADILRTHPELREDDIRACLAYTLEQEEAERTEGE